MLVHTTIMGLPNRSGEKVLSRKVSADSIQVPAPALRHPTLARDPQGLSTLASALRFQGILNRDYSIEYSMDAPFDGHHVFLAQRELLFRNLLKESQGDTSSLKLFMDSPNEDFYNFEHQCALADSFLLLPRPVDVIVKTSSSPAGLKVLLSATGKRLMYPSAELYLGKMTTAQPSGNATNQRSNLRLFHDYFEELKMLVHEQTGEANLSKIHADFHNPKAFNSLEALWYGKKGLVDAIIMGDSVITREDLKAYYSANGLKNREAIDAFNRNRENVFKIKPKQTLAEFSPKSVPPEPKNEYESLIDKYRRNSGSKKTPHKTTQETVGKTPHFYFDSLEPKTDVLKFERLPLRMPISKALQYKHAQVGNLSQHDFDASTLLRDAIYFNSPFDVDASRQICESLMLLDEKSQKQTQKDRKPTNLLIIQNSPGGLNISAREIRDTMHTLATPVDVITEGLAASNGAYLLSIATGNRFATPSSRIMIHQALFSSPSYDVSPDELYHATAGLNQEAQEYAETLSRASGKTTEEVMQDMAMADVWLSPLEALFYGPKGLIDGILVGPNRVLTRERMKKYLLDNYDFKSETLDSYLHNRIQEKFNPPVPTFKKGSKPNTDPFTIPQSIIVDASKKYAQALSTVARFKPSVPQKTNNLYLCHIIPEEKAEEE